MDTYPQIDGAAKTPDDGSLIAQTLVGLRCYFAARNHSPSTAMWRALQDLARVLGEMADGAAQQKLFLSSLDPGVGKTQTVAHFVRALVADQSYTHVGVIIFVGRLTEVRDMVDALALPPASFAVLTSDATLNRLSEATVDQARVLITTQQRIERQVAAGQFNNASSFFFSDRPRAVRVWDESYLPGQPITISADDIAKEFGLIGQYHPALRDTLVGIFNEINTSAQGSVYQVPDFADDHAVELNDVLAFVDDAGDANQQTRLSSLWALSGRAVTVKTDGVKGNTAITYRDTLPADLAPMVILDASGRVRKTYSNIEKGRGTLVRLAQAAKVYDRLTIHLWQTGGGKQAFQANSNDLAEGIAKTIDTKPDDAWLVVHHTTVDPQVVQERLKVCHADKVSFVNWGKHQASNDYVNVRNIILAGTLFYRPSHYEALARLSLGRDVRDGPIATRHLESMMIGEHSHGILQALCRGSVRRCDDEHCHPCDAYIIASVRSGIRAALPVIFPGCDIVRWQPIKRRLKGKVQAAIEFIEKHIASSPDDLEIRFATVAKALGMTTQNFRKDVRFHSDFQEAIAELGMFEWGHGPNKTRFLRFG